MKRVTIAGLGAGLLLSLSAFGAQALPAAAALDNSVAPLVETVADGCGPGFFRGGRGYCRPMRGFGGPRHYAPPRYYAPRHFYGGPRYDRGPRHGRRHYERNYW
jgi:hypothetical protein